MAEKPWIGDVGRTVRCFRYRLYAEGGAVGRLKMCGEPVTGTRPWERWTADGRLIVEDTPYCAEHLADQDRIAAVERELRLRSSTDSKSEFSTMPHPLVPVGALHLTPGLCYNAPDPPQVEPRGSHA